MKKLRQTKSEDCGNVSKMLQETYLQSLQSVKSFIHLWNNAVNEDAVKNNVINRFPLSINFY